MLDQCKAKSEAIGYSAEKIDYRQVDAESLPFEDNSFDIVISGMMLGLVVDQNKIVSEMFRVIRPGGDIAISTQGPQWYYEIVETLSKCFFRYYLLNNIGTSQGVEFWPLKEKNLQQLLRKAGFENSYTDRHIGQISFKNGSDVWKFFAAVSSAYFLELFKPDERKDVILTINNYFIKKNITTVTYDALMGYGRKP